MSFKVAPGPYRMRAGAAWGSIDILCKQGRCIATVWSGTKEPSMEQATANAEAIIEALKNASH